MTQIFMYDANLCSKCDPLEQPDEPEGEDIQEETEAAEAGTDEKE